MSPNLCPKYKMYFWIITAHLPLSVCCVPGCELHVSVCMYLCVLVIYLIYIQRLLGI